MICLYLCQSTDFFDFVLVLVLIKSSTFIHNNSESFTVCHKVSSICHFSNFENVWRVIQRYFAAFSWVISLSFLNQ